MNGLFEIYTTTAPATILPADLILPVKTEKGSGEEVRTWRLDFPRIVISVSFEPNRESFLGILTDNEAQEMKKEINLFKQRFDADLAGRNKILFGE